MSDEKKINVDSELENTTNEPSTTDKETKETTTDKKSKSHVDKLYTEEEEMIEQLENDELVDEEDLYALISQTETENMIAYKIEGLVKDDGETIKGRYQLYKEPPILTIKDNDDNEVQFLLTKNFTEELMYGLREVQNGYYGVNKLQRKKINEGKTRSQRIKDTIIDLPENMLKHPFQSIIGIFLIVILVITLFK